MSQNASIFFEQKLYSLLILLVKNISLEGSKEVYTSSVEENEKFRSVFYFLVVGRNGELVVQKMQAPQNAGTVYYNGQ
jgi:hypothetical protein